MQKSLLGENHPSTAISLIHLADLNSKKGQFKKEEEYLLQAKTITDNYENKIDISNLTV